jgi:HlyD family secretion protein
MRHAAMFNRRSIERRGSAVRAVAVAGAVIATAIGGWIAFGGGGGEGLAESFYATSRGPLRISLTIAGQVKAREQLIITSELEGQNNILFLKPEGTRVEKGELLIELDASSLIDRRVDQEITVQNTDAAYVSARENLEVVRNQAQSDVERAELDLRFAKQDLEKYREGELPREIMAAQARITLAEEEVSRTEEKYKWSQVLFGEKYLSQSELQADELAANKARLDLELAQTDLKLLREFTSVRQMAELESNVRQAGMALERIQRRANADIVQAEANLTARQSEYERERGRLEKLGEQIAKARIVAPMDGLVIYATSAQTGWRGNDEPLAEGQSVRERQALIHLPTTSSYNAEIAVHEASLDKIRVGLPARVTIDALPGQVFRGTVQTIAPLPNAQSMFLNPDLKVYDTKIAIEGDHPAIRNGMSCQAEIILAEYEDALYVPVQSVIRVGGVPTVYAGGPGNWEPRAVEIGLDNNRVVHIKSGLEEGERVLMAPPLDEGAVPLEGESIPPSVGPAPEAADGLSPAPAMEMPGAGDAESGRRGARRRGEGVGSGAESQTGEGSIDTEAGVTGEGSPEGMRQRFEQMSPEEREAMRQRLESMTPEQREALRAQFGRGRGAPGAADGR